MPDLADYRTVAQCAAIFWPSPTVITRWAAAGRIPGAVKLAGAWLIPAAWTPPPRRRSPDGHRQSRRKIRPQE